LQLSVSLVALRFSLRQTRAGEKLGIVEAEKLRRIEQPSFTAKYERGKIRFTMLSGPTEPCNVDSQPVGNIFLDVRSSRPLGYMQVGDHQEIDVVMRERRRKTTVQQGFLLNVGCGGREPVGVVVYCTIPPDPIPSVD
jgi:hypothetical protein